MAIGGIPHLGRPNHLGLPDATGEHPMTLAAIVVLAAIYAWLVPHVVTSMLGEPIQVRVLVTVLLLAPIGLLLGMAYPLGITVLREFGEGLVPWAWGLNGALSVVASVLAIFLGSRFGFSTAFVTGLVAYGVGLVVMVVLPRVAAAPVRSRLVGELPAAGN